MIHDAHGDILLARTQALVIPVNIVGVMGAGLALEFKKRYPDNYRAYRSACQSGNLVVGRVFTYTLPKGPGTRYLINFPTKRNWRDNSRLDDIELGLLALVMEAHRLDLVALAIPALGCGFGGLEWSEVRPLIHDAFTGQPFEVMLYTPLPA